MQKSIKMENRHRVLIPADSEPKNDKEATLLSDLLAMTSTTEERRAGHWIPVHSDHWRSLLGGSYREIIRQAVRAGHLEENQRYSAGRFAKSYRLAKRLRDGRWKWYESRRPPKSRIRIRPTDEAGLRLVRHFEAVSLPAIPSQSWAGYAVQCCLTGRHYAVRCEFGRFHSTFTSMPARVRRSLEISGQGVAEVDVANCQPLLVGLVATHTPNPRPTPYTHMLHSFQKYLNDCQAGVLYEVLLEAAGQMTLRDWIPARCRVRDRRLKRSDIKRQFLTMLFCDLSTTSRLPIFGIVSRVYPAIARFALEAKRNGHQELARQCQRLESSLVIDRIAFRLSEVTPCVTVHDAVIVPRDQAATAVDHIKATFAAYGAEVTCRG